MSGRLLVRPFLLRSLCRRIFSPAFSMEEAWSQRHTEMAKLGLGGDYEWIGTVQKKFIGGGVASAVDVDAAVCMAEEKDQVDDVLQIVRKLRHSPSAARLCPSSQYALLRLFIRHRPEDIIEIVNDPINNGIFPDEHCACLIIDHLIEKNEIGMAARVAGWVMQQEMFSSPILNCISIVALLKWTELSDEERKVPMGEKEEEEINDDDIVTIKMPFLKNSFNDEHFDLMNANSLVGKSLIWLSRETQLDENIKSGCNLIGSVLLGGNISPLLSSPSFLPCAAKTALSILKAIPEPSDAQKEYCDALSRIGGDAEDKFSNHVLAHLECIRMEEENKMMENQKKTFSEWNERRRQLVMKQAKRLTLNLRRLQLNNELSQLEEEEEKLFFFERRLVLERAAKENMQITQEATQMK